MGLVAVLLGGAVQVSVSAVVHHKVCVLVLKGTCLLLAKAWSSSGLAGALEDLPGWWWWWRWVSAPQLLSEEAFPVLLPMGRWGGWGGA